MKSLLKVDNPITSKINNMYKIWAILFFVKKRRG